MTNDAEDRVQTFTAKYRSLVRYAGLAEQNASEKTLHRAHALETELIDVLFEGVGRGFNAACDSVPRTSLYRVGGFRDIEALHYPDKRGICLTGENLWSRERWGREPAIGAHAEVDYWAIVYGGSIPKPYRATYSTVSEGPNLVRWTMSLEEVPTYLAVVNGLTVEQVAERIGEALKSHVARADRTDTGTQERIRKLEAIINLLTWRSVATLARLAVLGFFATYSIACGSDSSGSPPDAPPLVCTGSVLDPVTNACVQCTAADKHWCPTGRDVCRADNTCDICRANADCPSDVCMPDGTCALQDQVAYVKRYPVAGACTRESPCSADTAATSGKMIYRITEYAGFTAPLTVADTQRVTLVGGP